MARFDEGPKVEVKISILYGGPMAIVINDANPIPLEEEIGTQGSAYYRIRSLVDYANIIAAGEALHPGMLLSAIKGVQKQYHDFEWESERNDAVLPQIESAAIAALNQYPEGDHGYNPPMLVTMTSTAGYALHSMNYSSCRFTEYSWESLGDYGTLGSGPGMGIEVIRHGAPMWKGQITIVREVESIDDLNNTFRRLSLAPTISPFLEKIKEEVAKVVPASDPEKVEREVSRRGRRRPSSTDDTTVV